MKLDGHRRTGAKRDPTWWAEHEGSTSCDCEARAEREKEYVGYSDSAYLLMVCPTCDSRWRAFIEG